MVKFGTQLKHHQVPEWTSNYIEYDRIKNILQQIRNYRAVTNQYNMPKRETKITDKQLKRKILDNVQIIKEMNEGVGEPCSSAANLNIDKLKTDLSIEKRKRSFTQNLLKSSFSNQLDSTAKIIRPKHMQFEEIPEEIENELKIDFNKTGGKTIIKMKDKYANNYKKKNSLETEYFKDEIEGFDEFDIEFEEDVVIKKHLFEERKVIKLFFAEFKANLNKIDNFYNETNQEIRNKFYSLNGNFVMMNKKARYAIEGNEMIKEDNEIKEGDFIRKESSCEQQEELDRNRDNQENREKADTYGFSTSWRRAYADIYSRSSWLHGFCAINKIGVNKLIQRFSRTFINEFVLKEGPMVSKHINFVKSIVFELEELINQYHFILEVQEVGNLRMEIINEYSTNFCKKDIEIARDALEQNLIGGFAKEMKLISYFVGVLTGLVFLVIVLAFIPSKLLNYFK